MHSNARDVTTSLDSGGLMMQAVTLPLFISFWAEGEEPLYQETETLYPQEPEGMHRKLQQEGEEL